MIYFIMFIVVVLNALCIYLMYRFLKDIDKKEKFIFIAVSVAIMYGITVFIHWISIHNLEAMYQDGVAKDIVTFLFVPINGLIILPALASSYNSYKEKKLELDVFGKRMLVLLIPLLIVLILECVFLKNVQVAVSNAYIESTKFKYEEYIPDTNNTSSNSVTENVISNEMTNELTNELENEISEEEVNELSNEISDDVDSNTVKENKTKKNTTKENKVSNDIENNIVDED